MDKYAYNTALEDVLIEAALLLPTERTQIKDAHVEGTRNAIAAMKNEESLNSANHYFETNFTQKYKDAI